mmetsp:Transcript_13520/g.27959  ORF Transcript_13520/g.27959 Transcript_13520/m.27959 type:complete len:80 (-) Transcript_13520:222-461(-)
MSLSFFQENVFSVVSSIAFGKADANEGENPGENPGEKPEEKESEKDGDSDDADPCFLFGVSATRTDKFGVPTDNWSSAE